MNGVPLPLLAFGSNVKDAALSATRFFLRDFNALISYIAKNYAKEIKSPWVTQKFKKNVRLDEYNRQSPPEVLARVLLILQKYPNAAANWAAGKRRLDESGEPITIAVVLGGLATALTILGPIILPMIQDVIANVTGETEKREKAEVALAEKKSENKMIFAAVAGVVIIVGGVVLFRLTK
jgi:hypothetical protein